MFTNAELGPSANPNPDASALENAHEEWKLLKLKLELQISRRCR